MCKRFCLALAALLCCIVAADARDDRAGNVALLEAVTKMNAGEADMARHILRKAVAENPDNDALHYYCGYVAAMKNDAREALEHFEAAERLDSNNIWYQMRLANLYSLTGQNDKALVLYEKIVARRPGDPDMLSRLADSYLDSGRYSQADSLLLRVERLVGPNDYTTLSRIDLNNRRGTYDELFPLLDGFLSSPEISGETKRDVLKDLLMQSDSRFRADYINSYIHSVDLCAKMHGRDTAVTHFAAELYLSCRADSLFYELKADNQDDTSILQLSLSYNFYKKNYEGAIEDCKTLLSFDGLTRAQMSVYYSEMADGYQRLEMADDAIREYRHALALDKNNVMAANNYAYFLACLGRDLPKAESLSRRTIAVEPENPVYLDTYAWILYKQKKYSEAKKYLKKAILYGGKQSAEILEHYAAILDALGESSLAEGYRQQAAIKHQNED